MTSVRPWIVVPLAILFALPFLAHAEALDVNVNLIASGFEWHIDSPTNPAAPTVTVAVGDSGRFSGNNVIRFRVENQDTTLHTFTVPHFAVDENLTAGAVIFVNITATTADMGDWQFWCRPHSSGTTPEGHTGMIGLIRVNHIDVDLIAAVFEFHVGAPTNPEDPSITADAGDTIRFRVENQDSDLHTFTVPHFGINVSLDSGEVAFVNITTTVGDAGTWQFWCVPHSTGATPETHTGMIGTLVLTGGPPPPPRTPGFEALAAIAALGVAFTILAVRRRGRP